MARQQPSPDLYAQVVGITDTYLGPASERFIARQVEHHLHKHPHQLCQKDVTALIEWIRLAMGLLVDDQGLVEKYITELQRLR